MITIKTIGWSEQEEGILKSMCVEVSKHVFVTCVPASRIQSISSDVVGKEAVVFHERRNKIMSSAKNSKTTT